MRRGTCGSCGAPVLFVRTAARGVWQPLDAEPSLEGNIELVLDEELNVRVAVVRRPGEGTPDTARYLAHFVTCPDARKYRRRPA